MLFIFLEIFSCSLDICISPNPNDTCPKGSLTLPSFETIDNIFDNTNIQNVEERHLNLYIENTHKNPIFLNLNEFQTKSFTATLIGNKESSFAVIDFCGRQYDDKSVFSYDMVTIHPENTDGPSMGCMFTKNVDFQFSGFDSGKIYSKHLNKNKKILPKSIISFDDSGDYTVFEFPLLAQFTDALITRNSIILTIKDQPGTMTIGGLHKGTAFLDQVSGSQYPPFTITTNVTDDETDIPFLCIKVVKATNLTLGEFPKQPSGIPPFGIEVQTADEININGVSAVNSKFVLFDTEPYIKKSLNVYHADICPYHYGDDEKDKITFMFKNLNVYYGSFLKISRSAISIQTDQIQSTGYSLRQIDEFESYDNNKFQKVSLSQGMNYLKLTDQKFIISDGPDKSPKFQIDSNPKLNILVIQDEQSSTSLTIDTQSSEQTLNNLPNIELLFSKESRLNVISNLKNNQDSHFQIFGDNFGKPVTISSSKGNGFTFGLTDDRNGDFIIDGAKIELPDVEIFNVGQLTIKNTEFIKMSQNSNPIVSICNLFVNADFISQIPQLSVYCNLHILGEVNDGQTIPCQKGPNVFVDTPPEYDTVEISPSDIFLMNSKRQKKVTFSNISKGKVYFTQKSSSPTSYSLKLVYPEKDSEDAHFGCTILDFIDDASVSHVVNFVGDSWTKYSIKKSILVELRSSHRLTVNLKGHVPAKIVNNKGGELTIVPSEAKFGIGELELRGKMVISHSSQEKHRIYLRSFTLESTATLPSDRETEVSTECIVFDLGAFNLLQNSKMKIVSELTNISIIGKDELKTDFSLTFGGETEKHFTLIGKATSCSLSIENYVINYIKDDHTLTFKKFNNRADVYLLSQDFGTKTEIPSLQLNSHSSFIFDNTVVLKGVVIMDYNSILYARNNGKLIFSPHHDFITYYNLTNQYFPTIFSEKVPFEGRPFALSFWHPGNKESGSTFFNWVGYPLRAFCLPNFNCDDLMPYVDVEHPFNDFKYSFKPVCTNYEDKICISFNISRELYVPTPTRFPMPTTLPPATTRIPTRSEFPTEIPITSGGDVEPEDSKSHKKKKTGMIVGIVVGILALGALIGVLIWWLRKRSRDHGFQSFDPSLKLKLTDNNML